MQIIFRTPFRCQNNHFRWLFWEPKKDGFSNEVTWGAKHPDCKCPTGDLGEGFHVGGEHQLWTGLYDRNGIKLFRKDIVKYAYDWDFEGGYKKNNRVFKKEDKRKKYKPFTIGMVEWETHNTEHAHFIIIPYRLNCMTGALLIEIIGSADETPELLKQIEKPAPETNF